MLSSITCTQSECKASSPNKTGTVGKLEEDNRLLPRPICLNKHNIIILIHNSYLLVNGTF